MSNHNTEFSIPSVLCALLLQDPKEPNTHLADQFLHVFADSNDAATDSQIDSLIYWFRAHGALGKLCGWLKLHHPDIFALIPQLIRISLQIERQSMLAEKQIAEILARSQAENIEIVPFKGLVLSEELYGNSKWRIYDDLDFFVSKKELGRCIDVCQKLGYQSSWNPNQAQWKWLKATQCEYYMRRSPSELPIEIHWCALPLGYPGNLIYTSGKEWMWVYLLAHAGYKHYFDNIGHLTEAQLLSQQKGFNQEVAIALAKRNGCQRLVERAEILLHLVDQQAKYEKRNPNTYDTKEDHLKNSDWLDHWFGDGAKSWNMFKKYGWIRPLFPNAMSWSRLIVSQMFLPNIYDLRWIKFPPKLWWMYMGVKPIRKLLWAARVSKKYRDH